MPETLVIARNLVIFHDFLMKIILMVKTRSSSDDDEDHSYTLVESKRNKRISSKTSPHQSPTSNISISPTVIISSNQNLRNPSIPTTPVTTTNHHQQFDDCESESKYVDYSEDDYKLIFKVYNLLLFLVLHLQQIQLFMLRLNPKKTMIKMSTILVWKIDLSITILMNLSTITSMISCKMKYKMNLL